jgi:hypothetical protein
MAPYRNPWFSIATDAWLLGVEASTVMTLRTMKLAAGGAAAETEAARMVTEKVAALTELQMKAMTGGLGTSSKGAARKTLSHYRRKVRANRRRLTRG